MEIKLKHTLSILLLRNHSGKYSIFAKHREQFSQQFQHFTKCPEADLCRRGHTLIDSRYKADRFKSIGASN